MGNHRWEAGLHYRSPIDKWQNIISVLILFIFSKCSSLIGKVKKHDLTKKFKSSQPSWKQSISNIWQEQNDRSRFEVANTG